MHALQDELSECVVSHFNPISGGSHEQVSVQPRFYFLDIAM